MTYTQRPAAQTTSSNPVAVQWKSRADLQRDALRGKDFAAQEAALSPVQQKQGGGETDGVHEAAVAGTQGGGGALPFAAQIQHSFGRHDVSGIKAHQGADTSAACQAMGAEAFATGDHVAFGASPSLHTAAHEAAHIVQQQAGVSLAGGVGRAGDAYEQHADQVADAVVQGKSAEGLLDKMSGGGGKTGVQRMVVQQKLAIKSTHAPSPSMRAKLSNSTYVRILSALKKYEGKNDPKALPGLLSAIQTWMGKHAGKKKKASKLAYLKNLATAIQAELSAASGGGGGGAAQAPPQAPPKLRGAGKTGPVAGAPLGAEASGGVPLAPPPLEGAAKTGPVAGGKQSVPAVGGAEVVGGAGKSGAAPGATLGAEATTFSGDPALIAEIEELVFRALGEDEEPEDEAQDEEARGGGGGAKAPAAGGGARAMSGRGGAPEPLAPAGGKADAGKAPGAGVGDAKKKEEDKKSPAHDEAAAQKEDFEAMDGYDDAKGVFASVGDIDAFFMAKLVNWKKNLGALISKGALNGMTELEVRSLVGYTGPGYVPMNRQLRNQMKSHALTAAIKPYIKECNSALAKCKGTTVVKSTRGWRTMDSAATVRAAYPKGKDIEEAAFMSTTESTALTFFDGPVSLAVFGKSGVNVKEFSCAGAENERLYPAGSRFEVEDIVEDATLVKAWLDWQKTPPAGPKPTSPAFTITLREP